MIVIESPALDELLDDVDAPVRTLSRLRRIDPVVRDPTLVAKLLALHRALERAPRGRRYVRGLRSDVQDEPGLRT
jgi:hypothetical protein